MLIFIVTLVLNLHTYRRHVSRADSPPPKERRKERGAVGPSHFYAAASVALLRRKTNLFCTAAQNMTNSPDEMNFLVQPSSSSDKR